VPDPAALTTCACALLQMFVCLCVVQGLNGPPLSNAASSEFDSAIREVLTVSGLLDDVKKAIAEVWADGPDTTTTPGMHPCHCSIMFCDYTHVDV
jgi:hypothetical protein